MSSAPMDQLLRRISEKMGGWGRDTPLQVMRDGFADLVSSGREVPLEPVTMGGVPAAWTGSGEGVLLYFHGGGYQMGSIRSHGPLMADLASAAGVRALGFEYRLAPEHRYPAGPEDALAVYRGLLESGVAPQRIAFGGDSAGAGLALGCLLRAKASGLAMPAAAVFLSPWVDLEARGASYDSNAAKDPLTQRGKVLAMVRAYLGRDGDPADPLASPVNGDLTGLPDLLIHVGGDETVLGDSELLAARARAAGVQVDMVVWPGMVHHFQAFPELPQAAHSIAQIGDFLRRRIG